MDTESLFSWAIAFYQDHQLAVIAIGVGVLLFAFFQPKAFFKLCVFAAVAAVLFYFVSLFMDTALVGTKQKREAATRTERALE